MREVRSWKKVYEQDLDGICVELKDLLGVPSVVILSGDLGVGKTTFVRHFGKIINGPSFAVSSPSYSLINEMGKLVHADFYRLKDSEELVHLEIPLYLEDKEFILIEWGKPYIKNLRQFIGNEFRIYELELSLNPATEHFPIPSRNYVLNDLSGEI